MAKIEVNHQTMRELAKSADAYCKTQEKEMKALRADVSTFLQTGWTGPDATKFSTHFEIRDHGNASIEKTMLTAMKAYRDTLIACADLYKTAQEEVYNLSWFKF